MLSGLPTQDSLEFKVWLGRYLTEPKPQFQIPPPDQSWNAAQLRDWIEQGGGLCRHPFARMLWSQLDTSTIALFYQGEEHRLKTELGAAPQQISEQRTLTAAELRRLLDSQPDAIELLLDLLNQGVLEPPTAP